MTQFVQASSFNPAALQVDDLYIVIQPPPSIPQGQASGACAMIGTGSWGPLNTPMLVGNSDQVVGAIGGIGVPALTDPYDLATDAILALQQGQPTSPLLWLVRISDGTHTSASATLQDTAGTPATGMTVTGRYSGILGNKIQIILAAGAKAGTTTVSVIPQWNPNAAELYPNLPSAGAGVFWSNLQSALNNGLSGVRGPSQLLIASGASGTAITPALGTFTLTGGTDGRSGVTSSNQLGSDSALPKTGLYSLRGMTPAVAVVWLCGNTDATAYATMSSFANTEGCLALGMFPTGTSSSGSVTIRQTAAIDNPNFIFIKDFVYFLDTANNQSRLVPSLPVVGGLIAATSPEQSPANLPVFGIQGTERVSNIQGSLPYTNAELGLLESSGITLITAPSVGGSYFGMRNGVNSSTNADTSVIEYARMTNFLAKYIGSFAGKFVNKMQTKAPNDPLRLVAGTALRAAMQGLKDNSQISDYQIILDTTNNSPTSVRQRYMYAKVRVEYLSSVKFFVINLQGGVTISNS